MHGLTERDSMVSAKGIVPWHRHPNARVLNDDALTMGEAIEAAGLAWQVEKWPAYVQAGEGGPMVPVPDRYWTVRTDVAETDVAAAVLGCVRGGYHIVQNHALFAFTDALLAHGGAHYDTAGSLFGGRKGWALAHFPEASIEEVRGVRDPHRAYCLVWNSHDGTSALTASVVWVRVVCNNTLRAALAGQVSEWRLRHTGHIEDALEDAREALGIVVRATMGYATLLDELAREPFSDEDFKKLLEHLRPARGEDVGARMAAERETLWRLWAESPHVNHEGLGRTRYAALNAVTEWADHERGRPEWREKHPDQQLYRVLWGSGHELKQKALTALTADL